MFSAVINILSCLRHFSREKRGIAAVEFALLTPIMILLGLGVSDLYFRFQAQDQFSRYVYQIGDYAAQSTELKSGDLDDFLDSAEMMMNELQTADIINLSLASIGFDKKNEPVLLWTRSVGFEKTDPSVSLSDAIDLGEHGETVLRLNASYVYKPPFAFMGKQEKINNIRSVYFRPRSTRAVAMDDDIAELAPNWEN